ncbi:MAG: hypothetical protein GTN62_08415, partial [Gemmatimonadales bacterium]|nr:hypothetical protein [Gemmatimonadales bacterium]NIN50121.1 hypothetical protein [Gemmatimonadales bacterium]NIP07585.1 hypothetical protein [Gemmatimonadales bacterium]
MARSSEKLQPPALDCEPDESHQIIWHARELSAIYEELQTSPKAGLSSEEVARRLSECGPNELEEAPRPGFWRMVLHQFNNFIVIILLIAAVLSALLGDFIEAIAIMAIVVLNAVLGVIQERRAEEALAAL